MRRCKAGEEVGRDLNIFNICINYPRAYTLAPATPNKVNKRNRPHFSPTRREV